MPSERTTHVLSGLAAVLARTPPEHALRDALAFVREHGVVSTEEAPASAPLVTLSYGARMLVLGLREGAALEPQAHAPLADLVRVAYARSAEHEELLRVRERVGLLSSASFEGLFFHVDGVIFDANQRLSELLGYEHSEILGEQTMHRCVAPEDLPQVMQQLASGFQGEYIVTAIRKDGSRFRAEVQTKQGKLGNRPVRVAAVRDVTARERTQALLRESEQRLRSLAETAFDLTVFSRGGAIVDVVGSLHDVLGYRREDMVGRPILDFVPQSSARSYAR